MSTVGYYRPDARQPGAPADLCPTDKDIWCFQAAAKADRAVINLGTGRCFHLRPKYVGELLGISKLGDKPLLAVSRDCPQLPFVADPKIDVAAPGTVAVWGWPQLGSWVRVVTRGAPALTGDLEWRAENLIRLALTAQTFQALEAHGRKSKDEWAESAKIIQSEWAAAAERVVR